MTVLSDRDIKLASDGSFCLLVGATGDGLLREFRVIKLSEAACIPDIATIAADSHHRRVAERAAAYGNRTR